MLAVFLTRYRVAMRVVYIFVFFFRNGIPPTSYAPAFFENPISLSLEYRVSRQYFQSTSPCHRFVAISHGEIFHCALPRSNTRIIFSFFRPIPQEHRRDNFYFQRGKRKGRVA